MRKRSFIETINTVKQHVFSLTGVKYVMGMVCTSVFAATLMSFSNYTKVPPGKDKKLPEPKAGPKGFVNLLPTTTTPVLLNPTTGAIASSNVEKEEEVKIGLNPKVKSFAHNYIHDEITDLSRMKVWAKPIFKQMDNILIEHHLPTQLKYLAVIESSLQRNLRMSSGALGPWQLMPDEARRYGLIKNGHDYRIDYEQSTIAACKLLTSLHNKYHDWLITIAAYNCGTGGMDRAIDKAGSSDFWKVQAYLPEETRNHVKKFISTHYYFEGSGGITTMSAKETKKYNTLLSENNDGGDAIEFNPNSNIVRIKGLYNAESICKVLHLNATIFLKDNPNFNKALADGQFYDMHLPDGKASEFVDKKDEIVQSCFNQLLNGSKNNQSITKNRTKIDR